MRHHLTLKFIILAREYEVDNRDWEVIRNLPDEKPLTEILTDISGKSGQNGSNSVKIGSVKKSLKTA